MASNKPRRWQLAGALIAGVLGPMVAVGVAVAASTDSNEQDRGVVDDAITSRAGLTADDALDHAGHEALSSSDDGHAADEQADPPVHDEVAAEDLEQWRAYRELVRIVKCGADEFISATAFEKSAGKLDASEILLLLDEGRATEIDRGAVALAQLSIAGRLDSRMVLAVAPGEAASKAESLFELAGSADGDLLTYTPGGERELPRVVVVFRERDDGVELASIIGCEFDLHGTSTVAAAKLEEWDQ